MEQLPILIFECANAHGGKLDALMQTINECAKITYPRRHIKFQPFHSDTLALADYSWYQVYRELLFSQNEWAELIALAAKSLDGVWLDIFDRYGADILATNAANITGIKLQASVLENYEVFNALRGIPLAEKPLMLNISGYELTEIENFIRKFEQLQVGEIILQIGHQSYPTQLKDTGLQKIGILQAAFPGIKLCIADHAPAEDYFAGIVPLFSVAAGCDVVEKHICLNRASAKYDHYSALEPQEMQLLADRLSVSRLLFDGSFISPSEREYLAKSVQIPVAAKQLPAGSLISESDVIFRRTRQDGITFREISEIQKKFRFLDESIEKGSTIKTSQFRSARIGVVVAGRMKSSRLKQKAILPIDGRASIERCLDNCLQIPGAEVVVLATSTLDEDSVLEKYTLDGKVKIWRGDPDDVIQRYLGACDEYGIDVIVRVTADCPVVSPEIAKFLLDHHFNTGADFTGAKHCAVGTGCEIYNTQTLRKVIEYLGKAEYSEYMTWYMWNNKHLFKVEMVDLPSEMVRDYRLTLDHQEDLEMFTLLYAELAKKEWAPSLQNVFTILDENPEISNLNGHLTLRYKTDLELIEKLDRVTKINVPSSQG